MDVNKALPDDFYVPKYWAAWICIGIFKATAKLPFSWQIQLGKMLGASAYYLASNRRHITRVNIEHCFPELSPSEKTKLIKKTIQENVICYFEYSYAWWGKPGSLKSKVKVIGLENVQTPIKNGQGVLMIGAHYSNLDLGGILTSFFTELDVVYRKHDNPIFNWAILKGRRPYFGRVIDKYKIRDMIKSIKSGRVLWYAADQDYGRENSVFADFFGIKAATVVGSSRIAKLSKAQVIVIRHHRLPRNEGYEIEFSKPLKNFPSGDDALDAKNVNAALEKQIRKFPEQYYWVHR